MVIPICAPVKTALAKLQEHGFEAYLVGGCVRDSLMGHAPHDWDIATSAHPENTRQIFAEFPVIDTGIAHGTVTVLIDHMPLEITTYRIDGSYSDCRRPDQVLFTPSLTEDLKRRDFTINAMAYHPERGLVDPFGGMQDLNQHRICCVGSPDRRFQEDALRILRALRFAAVLNFSIEPETAGSVLKNRGLLSHIARERVSSELTKLLCGDQAASVLRNFREVFTLLIPELEPLFLLAQHNPYHTYTVWEHSLHALDACPSDAVLRLAALFHDIGKASTFSLDKNGIGHFYGHTEKSADETRNILKRFRMSNHMIEETCLLIRWHDIPLQAEEHLLKRRLARFGEERLRRLIALKRADCKAQSSLAADRLTELDQVESLLSQILQQEACFSLRQLSINGNDLLALGFPPGPAIGKTLAFLLDAVIRGECPNKIDALTTLAQNYRKELP